MENEIDFIKKKIIVKHYQLVSNGSDGDSVSPDLGSNWFGFKLLSVKVIIRQQKLPQARKVLIRLLCHVCISCI